MSRIPPFLKGGKWGFFSYYWIFPKEKGLANVGVLCTVCRELHKESLDLKKHLDDMLDREHLQDYEIVEAGGGMASAWVLPRLVFDNILLIGDAAGLTSPLHGGGIDMACLSGVVAVSAIADGSKGVGKYEKRLARYLQDKLALEAITVQKMRTLNFDAFDELLAGVTSRSNATRATITLRNPDLLFATYKWLRNKKKSPQWPA